MNFKIVKIESLLRLWLMENLMIEGKVLSIQNSLLSLITTVSRIIINQQYIKRLYMERTNPKMKHSTLSNSGADVFTKVISL